VQRFGEDVQVEFFPGGAEKDVTNENKAEFIEMKIQFLCYDSKKEQIDKFLAGFWEVCPVDLLRVFTCAELEQVMCGTPEIDITDWKNNTFYQSKIFTPTHEVITWFWEYVESLDAATQCKVLQFITASSVVPVEGFAGLQGSRGDKCPFTISDNAYTQPNENNQLPRAHTCFNKLDLPVYPSRKCLFSSMQTAIEVECEGFYHE